MDNVKIEFHLWLFTFHLVGVVSQYRKFESNILHRFNMELIECIIIQMDGNQKMLKHVAFIHCNSGIKIDNTPKAITVYFNQFKFNGSVILFLLKS